MAAITIIVPNFNHARFLPRRIESILRQTFDDFEVLIFDDASTDDSRGVIARYLSDRRVRFFENTVNSGAPFPQWNRGVDLARSDFVWIAESDDYAAPEFLDTLLPWLREHANVGLAYCQSVCVDAEDRVLGTMESYTRDLDGDRWSRAFVNNGRDECRRFLLWKNTIPNASAVVFRRDAYLRSGGAPTDMRLAGDWLAWARMLQNSDVAFVPDCLNFFRQGPSTIRAASMGRTYFDERWRVQRFLLRRGSISAPARRRIAAMLVEEYLSRVRMAAQEDVWAEVAAGWRAYRSILRYAPVALARVSLGRLYRRLVVPQRCP